MFNLFDIVDSYSVTNCFVVVFFLVFNEIIENVAWNELFYVQRVVSRIIFLCRLCMVPLITEFVIRTFEFFVFLILLVSFLACKLI